MPNLIPFIDPFSEMERALAEFQNRYPEARQGFIPAVDVYEKDGKVHVETAIPGVDAKDVEVTVDGGVLTLRGKSEHRSEVDEKNYYRKEVRYGAFQRQVPLPTPVIGEKAEASVENGVLHVAIPKAKSEKPKGIKVEVKKK